MAEEKIVLFYSYGTRCAVRLVVALYSLRKVWTGRVIVLCEGPQMAWLLRAVRHLGAEIKPFKPQKGFRSLFCRKPELWQHLPRGNRYLYVDSDVIFLEPVESLFDFLDDKPFVITQFSKWRCSRIKHHRWYKRWRKAIGHEIDADHPMVNMGLVAWRDDAQPILEEWLRLTRLMDAHGFHDTDELAISSMFPNAGIKVIPHHWNQSTRLSWPLEDLKKYRNPGEHPHIVHFHGDRHFRYDPPFPDQSKFWLRWRDAAIADLPCGDNLRSAYGDYFYQRWIDTCGVHVLRRTDFPKLIDAKGYKTGVEVGVSEGRFSNHLLYHSKLEVLFSVDRWDAVRRRHMGSPEHEGRCRWRLSKFGGRSVIIKSDSIAAAAKFMDYSLDFVYIDAGHTYEDCWADMQAWWPKIRPGGCLAGHDWAPRKGWGVPQAVEDFKAAHGLPMYFTRDDEPQTHESWMCFRQK